MKGVTRDEYNLLAGHSRDLPPEEAATLAAPLMERGLLAYYMGPNHYAEVSTTTTCELLMPAFAENLTRYQ